MDKEKFLKAVLQAADRIVARALENGPAVGYDLQLHGISISNEDILSKVIHGETLIEVDGTWIVGTQYRKEETT